MAAAARLRSGRTTGVPEARPSAPVCAWPAPSATTPGPQLSQAPLTHYDPTTLHALNPGRSNTCFQAHPKRTHGPFACNSCKRTFHNATTTTTSPRAINQLKCILVNARSVHKHAIELWDLLDSIAPDVAFITESWMNASSAPDITTAIPKATRSPEKTAPTRGSLVYRPPGPRAPFSDAIVDFISPHALASPDYILLGDLNFHLEQNNDPNTTTLLDNLANLGLKQLVNTATHIAGHTLDPIFSASKHVFFSHASALHWTDHSCIHFTFRRETRHLCTQPIPRRQWNKIPEEQLFSALAANQPTLTTDPNDAALNLTNWISN
ncbi:hypothetical protein NDU88_004460 [Pleurodeles waltl]|uniref:Endonuclease/exonuclease/phosphatase domain-containing protein n=1 Tax=Pleurodeles waltl TaxID=8319 RepID=A0AAV7SIX5_PLEWA|nr:hypothetical protein NDU88_004460 [Pleurodeles waltl]